MISPKDKRFMSNTKNKGKTIIEPQIIIKEYEKSAINLIIEYEFIFNVLAVYNVCVLNLRNKSFPK